MHHLHEHPSGTFILYKFFSVKGRSLYIINQDGKAIHRKLAQGVSSIN